jgi:hypothetical protein
MAELRDPLRKRPDPIALKLDEPLESARIEQPRGLRPIGEQEQYAEPAATSGREPEQVACIPDSHGRTRGYGRT